MRVKWLEAALANLDAEVDDISEENAGAALRMGVAVLDAVNELKRFPALGRPGRVVGTRELVVLGTPYIVPYRVRGNSVEILRVFHAARRWPNEF